MSAKGIDKDLLAVLRDHACAEGAISGLPDMCMCGWEGKEHARHLAKMLMAVGVNVKLPKINGTAVTLTLANLTPVRKWAERLFDAAIIEGTTKNRVRPHLRDSKLALDSDDGRMVKVNFEDRITYLGGGRFRVAGRA